MKCDFCEFARECTDPAQFGGGCDIDGVDDFGCDSGNDGDDGDPDRNGRDCESCEHCHGIHPQIIDYDTGEAMDVVSCVFQVFATPDFAETCARYQRKKGGAE